MSREPKITKATRLELERRGFVALLYTDPDGSPVVRVTTKDGRYGTERVVERYRGAENLCVRRVMDCLSRSLDCR